MNLSISIIYIPIIYIASFLLSSCCRKQACSYFTYSLHVIQFDPCPWNPLGFQLACFCEVCEYSYLLIVEVTSLLAQNQTSKTRVFLFIWHLLLFMSSKGDPTNSCTTVTEVFNSQKSLHHH
jgi:hypothetical protein